MTTPRGPIGYSPKATLKQTAGSARAAFKSRGTACRYEESLLEYAYRTRNVVAALEKARSTYVVKAVINRVGKDK